MWAWDAWDAWGVEWGERDRCGAWNGASGTDAGAGMLGGGKQEALPGIGVKNYGRYRSLLRGGDPFDGHGQSQEDSGAQHGQWRQADALTEPWPRDRQRLVEKRGDFI